MSESGKRVLLLLDDVVNDIRKNKGVDKALAKILYNRRHITANSGDESNGVCKNKGVDKALAKILYNRRHTTADGGDDSSGVSIWLTTQAYNRIPLMLRKVANGYVVVHISLDFDQRKCLEPP